MLCLPSGASSFDAGTSCLFVMESHSQLKTTKHPTPPSNGLVFLPARLPLRPLALLILMANCPMRSRHLLLPLPPLALLASRRPYRHQHQPIFPSHRPIPPLALLSWHPCWLICPICPSPRCPIPPLAWLISWHPCWLRPHRHRPICQSPRRLIPPLALLVSRRRCPAMFHIHCCLCALAQALLVASDNAGRTIVSVGSCMQQHRLPALVNFGESGL